MARFPLKEARNWAISTAASSAELDISLGDSSILLPLGLELESFVIAGKGRALVTPHIDVLGVKANPFSLIGSRKKLSFYIINGGEGKGAIVIEEGKAEIGIEANLLDIGGLKLKNGAVIERGKVSIKGSITIEADYMKGKGSLHAEGSDMLIKNASLFAPELPLKKFTAKLDKNGATVMIKALALVMDGLQFNGQGTIKLAKPAQNSSLDLGGKIELSEASYSPLSGMISMIKGPADGGNNFTIHLSGTVKRPDLKINGKKLF